MCVGMRAALSLSLSLQHFLALLRGAIIIDEMRFNIVVVVSEEHLKRTRAARRGKIEDEEAGAWRNKRARERERVEACVISKKQPH